MPNHGQGGRPPKGVANFKDEILDRLYKQKWKHHGVIRWLADSKNIHISPRTLQRQLKKWDTLQQDRTIDTEELRKRIDVMFCKLRASDKEMLEMLNTEGFTVTSREDRAHTDEAIQRLIEEELGMKVIQGYGRGLVVERFRKLGDPVKRDRLFAKYRALVPDAVAYCYWPIPSVVRGGS